MSKEAEKGVPHWYSNADFLKVQSIPNALANFTEAENERLKDGVPLVLKMEVEAYAASDQESPQYIYENCNRFRLPDRADGSGEANGQSSQ